MTKVQKKHKALMKSNLIVVTEGKQSDLYLLEDQIERLLAVVDNTRDLALLSLAFDIGPRRSEISDGLLLEHLDLEERLLKVIDFKKDTLRVEIPFTVETAARIKMFLQVRGNFLRDKKDRRLFGIGEKTVNRIFQKYLEKSGVLEELRESAKRLNIKKPRFGAHLMRHSCVRLRRKEGWSWTDISSITGDMERTLERVYGKKSGKQLRDQFGTQR